MIMTKLSLDSYIEVEVNQGIIVVFERAGEGMTQELMELLRTYGLVLAIQVDTPCG